MDEQLKNRVTGFIEMIAAKGAYARTGYHAASGYCKIENQLIFEAEELLQTMKGTEQNGTITADEITRTGRQLCGICKSKPASELARALGFPPYAAQYCNGCGAHNAEGWTS